MHFSGGKDYVEAGYDRTGPNFSLGVIRAINEGTLDGFEMELDHNKMTMPISDFPEMIEYCKNVVGEDYDKLRENIDKYSK